MPNPAQPCSAETRFVPQPQNQLATRADGDRRFIEGYGAVFYRDDDPGTEYQLWGNTYERIMPTAFDEIADADVRSFFNHDANFVLGRTRSKSLQLRTDHRGLWYSATVPDSQTIRDLVLGPIDRGDVDGSSFMFVPTRVTWIEEKRGEVDVDIRQIDSVELLEVGPVVFPAYDSTTSQARSAAGPPSIRTAAADIDGILQEWKRWKTTLGRRPDSGTFSRAADDAEQVAVQLRLSELLARDLARSGE